MRTVYDSNDPVNDRKLSLTAKEAVAVKLLEDRGFGVRLSRREVTEEEKDQDAGGHRQQEAVRVLLAALEYVMEHTEPFKNPG